MSSLDRRQLLGGGLALAGGAAFLPLARGASARPGPRGDDPGQAGADPAPRRLVVIELYGGNDGLDTVVPFEDDRYHRARPTLRLDPRAVLRLDDARGLHPSLARLRRRFDAGQVAIVEGCGYPRPVLSHFKSLEIWHTGRAAGRASGDGWIGRLRAAAWADDPRTELVAHVGTHVPYSLHSRRFPMLSFETPETYVFVGTPRERDYHERAGAAGGDPRADGRAGALARLRRKLADAQQSSPRVVEAAAGYAPGVAYPDDELGRSLRTVAAMIDAGFGTRVFSVSHGNFDTHGPAQLRKRRELLESWDAALDAFLSDLARGPAGAQTAVLLYSEFGRRVAENESRGTDHGAAGPMFLVGPAVQGGLYGAPPSLAELDADGNLVHTTDFRRVLATVCGGWFGVEAQAVLGRPWEPLPLFRA